MYGWTTSPRHSSSSNYWRCCFGGAIYPEYVDSQKPIKNTTVFHVTLADPALYDCDTLGAYQPSNCEYSEVIFVEEEGMYEFRFVANGDSPQKLSVDYGKSADRLLDMVEQTITTTTHVRFPDVCFSWKSLVEGGMSSWYTWEYQIDSTVTPILLGRI